MNEIRTFQNADLPALVEVWCQHWAAIGPTPAVGAAIVEQAILSRTFFQPSQLFVAQVDGELHAWCHCAVDPADPSTAIVSAVCFTTDGGRAICDELLAVAESRISELGVSRLIVGPLRDQHYGFAGLAPVGHGIGIPDSDSRGTSLLERAGFKRQSATVRLLVSTSPYRPPVSRESVQFRRTTHVEIETLTAQGLRDASAMSHLDIESHRLINHRTKESLANVRLWTSDPEAQVMASAESILDLGDVHARGQLTPEEAYLIGAIVQTLANRRIFSVETAVDDAKTELINQLQRLQFQVVETGHRWEKRID